MVGLNSGAKTWKNLLVLFAAVLAIYTLIQFINAQPYATSVPYRATWMDGSPSPSSGPTPCPTPTLSPGPLTCSDPDGSDVTRQGICRDVSGAHTDYCTGAAGDESTVREYTCSHRFGTCVNNRMPCPLGYYCNNGACVLPGPTPTAGPAPTPPPIQCTREMCASGAGIAASVLMALGDVVKLISCQGYYAVALVDQRLPDTIFLKITKSVPGKAVPINYAVILRTGESWSDPEEPVLTITFRRFIPPVSMEDELRVDVVFNLKCFITEQPPVSYLNKPIIHSPSDGQTFFVKNVSLIFSVIGSFADYVCLIGGNSYPNPVSGYLAYNATQKTVSLGELGEGKHEAWVSCKGGGVFYARAKSLEFRMPPICSDSDGGYNIYAKGTCVDSTGSYTDICICTDGTCPALREYSCSPPQPGVMQHCIPSDTECTCVDGACVPAPPPTAPPSCTIVSQPSEGVGPLQTKLFASLGPVLGPPSIYPDSITLWCSDSDANPTEWTPVSRTPFELVITKDCSYPAVSSTTAYTARVTAMWADESICLNITQVTVYAPSEPTPTPPPESPEWVRSDVVTFYVKTESVNIVSPTSTTYYSSSVLLSTELWGPCSAYECKANLFDLASRKQYVLSLGSVNLSNGHGTQNSLLNNFNSSYQLNVSCSPSPPCRGASLNSSNVFFTVSSQKRVNKPVIYSPQEGRIYGADEVFLNFSVTGSFTDYTCSRKVDGVERSIGIVQNNLLFVAQLIDLGLTKHLLNVSCTAIEDANYSSTSDDVSFFVTNKSNEFECNTSEDCLKGMFCWENQCMTCICVKDDFCNPCCGLINSTDPDCADPRKPRSIQFESTESSYQPPTMPAPPNYTISLSCPTAFVETPAKIFATLFKDKEFACDPAMVLQATLKNETKTFSLKDFVDCATKGKHLFEPTFSKVGTYSVQVTSNNATAECLLRVKPREEMGWLPDWWWIILIIAVIVAGVGYYYYRKKKREREEEGGEGLGGETISGEELFDEEPPEIKPPKSE